MRGNNFGYMLGQALRSIWRNGIMSIASVTVLMSCLVLIGSFSMIVYNINVNLEEIGMMNEIVVICDYDADAATIQNIGNEIKALDNVSGVTYVSKEDALENERDRYGEYSYLFDDLEDDNPLPDVYQVTYADNNKVSDLVYGMEQITGVSKVNNRVDIARDIENVKNGISFIFIWFLVILFVVSIFIIINTIKLAVETRSREITAMRYVGATNFFMTTPFVLEGAILGLLAAGVAYLIQYNLYIYTFRTISGSYNMITVVPFAKLAGPLALGCIVIGIFAGVLGSRLSLRKYMKI